MTLDVITLISMLLDIDQVKLMLHNHTMYVELVMTFMSSYYDS